MHIKNAFELKNIEGQNIVVCTSKDKSGFSSSIKLNAHAAFLWHELKKGEKTKEQLLHALLDNFNISTVLALNDIDIFVKTLIKNGIIEE